MGTDKAFVVWQGRMLIEHAVERIRPQVSRLAINANGDPARYAAFGLPVLADPWPNWPGPLAGVLAAMAWARGFGVSRVLTVPVDAPLLPPDLVARLADRPGLVRASSGERSHPVVALWPVTLAPAIERALAAGQGRVRDVMGDAVEVTFDACSMVNLNTPEDLAADTAPTRRSP